MNDFHAELRAALAPLLNEPTPAAEPIEIAPLTVATMPPRRPWIGEVVRDERGLMTQVILRPAENL